MEKLIDTIHVNMEYFDGQDMGYPCYVASCVEIASVTDGEYTEQQRIVCRSGRRD